MNRARTAGDTVGKTRDGKSVFMYLITEQIGAIIHPRNSDFTMEDHFDAYSIFEYLTLREKRKKGEDSRYYLSYAEHVLLHSDFLRRNNSLRSCFIEAKLTSAFTVRDHGQNLVNVEYRDL